MATAFGSPELSALLQQQDGLVSYAQAVALGVTASALARRVRPGGGWQRVLPRVYLQGDCAPTDRQRSRAAVLFAGSSAALTGRAALRWHRIKYLPDELQGESVDVVVLFGRQVASHRWARVHRTARECSPYLVDGLRVVPVTRAVVDAVPGLPYDATLATAAAGINAGRTSVEQLVDELATAGRRGSAALSRALQALEAGTRSVPEADFLRLISAAGLPAPLVNEALVVAGRRLVPDFRWGRVIVEVDSKAHHLLRPGAWERTQARRAFLQAHGYVVIPVTPEMVRDSPEDIIASVLAALDMVAAG